MEYDRTCVNCCDVVGPLIPLSNVVDVTESMTILNSLSYVFRVGDKLSELFSSENDKTKHGLCLTCYNFLWKCHQSKKDFLNRCHSGAKLMPVLWEPKTKTTEVSGKKESNVTPDVTGIKHEVGSENSDSECNDGNDEDETWTPSGREQDDDDDYDEHNCTLGLNSIEGEFELDDVMEAGGILTANSSCRSESSTVTLGLLEDETSSKTSPTLAAVAESSSDDCGPPSKRRRVPRPSTSSDGSEPEQWKTLMSHFVQINQANSVILGDIKKLLTPDVAPSLANVSDFVDLPLKSLNDVQELEQILSNKNKYDALVAFLSGIGGINLKGAVRNIMKKLLSISLSLTFSYTGKGNEKRPYNIYPRINEIVIESIRKQKHLVPKGTIVTESDLKVIIQDYFRFLKPVSESAEVHKK